MLKILSILLRKKFYLTVLFLILSIQIASPIDLKQEKPATTAISEHTPMNLREKIAQMLIMGFNGTHIDDTDNLVKNYITDSKIGGVILFDSTCYKASCNENMPTFVKNIENLTQLQQLTHDLQSCTEIPLLIGIDYEGGQVQRLIPNPNINNFPETESQLQLGTRNKDRLITAGKDEAEADKLAKKIAETQYAKMAEMLAEGGINLNFAPVIDLYYDGSFLSGRDRVYSSDPITVIEYAKIAIQNYHKRGILCTLKHFPGHGSASDTHLGFADISKTWDHQQDLKPFATLASLPQTQRCDFIMTAHVFNTHLDSAYPASLSYNITTKMLREDGLAIATSNGNKITVGGLNFDGLIITDDMQMGAIINEYDLEEAAIKAISAGADMLIFGNNLARKQQDPGEIIDIVVQAVEAGVISEAHINTSCKRIMKLKKKLYPENKNLNPDRCK